MSNVSKLHILSGLFVFLVLILFVRPSLLGNLYASLLGRVFLVLVVLFFAMNNVTLGLLTALVIIIASNMFLYEGLDNMDSTSSDTLADNIASRVSTIKEKVQAKMNEPSVEEDTDGVDLETVKTSIQPKSSSTLPVSPPSSSEHVSPASTEPFTSMYAPV